MAASANGGEMAETIGSRPVPDPTELTDKAIAKATASLTDYVDGKFALLSERINGADSATNLRLQTIDAIPTLIDKEVKALQDLHDEKFKSVAQQFVERDTRQEREARDNKVAVDAAFAAQKEAAAKQDEANQKAIDKSEIATNEKINKLEQLVTVKTDAIDGKIEDVKARVVDVATTANGTIQRGAGGHERSDDMRLWILAAFTVAGFVAAIVLGVIAAVKP